MVYNKAYRVYFTNYYYNFDLEAEEQDVFREYIKVRKGENLTQEAYEDRYEAMETGLVPRNFDNADGVNFDLDGWSYNADDYQAFDPAKAITRKMEIVACYADNQSEVEENRDELEAYLQEAIALAGDYFLTKQESGELLDVIAEVQEVFNRTEPRKATVSELILAINKLTPYVSSYTEKLDTRYTHYDTLQYATTTGGSSSGGGGKGGGSKSNPYKPENETYYLVGTNGNWKQDEATGKWSFVLNGGISLVSTWGKLVSGDDTGWYHFNVNGEMDAGWFQDKDGNWYYANESHDGSYGKMKTNWLLNGSDQQWYYLDPESGIMATGWRLIDGKWYYFAGPVTPETSLQNAGKPLGSMYKNETTPDGYRVGADGAWIE
jgi:glucan-binding YG repeat protein